MTGDNLIFAETWLKESDGKTPEPTDLQREYISASRRAEDEGIRRFKQLRQATIIAAVVGLIAVVITIIASLSTVQANERLNTVGTAVTQNEARIESLRLAAMANDELQNGNLFIASLLSIRGLNTSYTSQADSVLFRALSDMCPQRLCSVRKYAGANVRSSNHHDELRCG